MAAARSATVGSLASTLHFPGETHEGTLRRLARRFRARFVQRHGELFIAVAQLDARDDRLPLLGLQTLERLFVGLHGFAPNGLLERRLRTIELQAIKAGDIGLSSFAPELVANAIEDRLPQIRLKRSDPARLESRNR